MLPTFFLTAIDAITGILIYRLTSCSNHPEYNRSVDERAKQNVDGVENGDSEIVNGDLVNAAEIVTRDNRHLNWNHHHNRHQRPEEKSLRRNHQIFPTDRLTYMTFV